MSGTTNLDCRGLACPEPVLRCKREVEANAPEAFTVIVDNEAARQNVARFLKGKGYDASVEENGGEFTLGLVKNGAAPAADAAPAETARGAAASAAPEQEQVAAFITSDCMGSGDDELGAKLMINFLATLPELGDKLWRIILVNGAVKTACEGHPALEKLRTLEEAGVSILVCGTCLDHFDLLEAKQVGETTNMLDVVTSLELATKVMQV